MTRPCKPENARESGVQIPPREHPILFSTPMVCALLADRKSVTRRMLKRWLKVKAGDRLWVRETWNCTYDLTDTESAKQSEILRQFQAGEVKDIVSAAMDLPVGTGERRAMYAADFGEWARNPESDLHWRPSIHMPRWASRILLECEEDARLEPLQDITEEEAEAEGVDKEFRISVCVTGVKDYRIPNSFRGGFVNAWNRLHTKPGVRWEDNPEVVRVGRFKRIAPNSRTPDPRTEGQPEGRSTGLTERSQSETPNAS